MARAQLGDVNLFGTKAETFAAVECLNVLMIAVENLVLEAAAIVEPTIELVLMLLALVSTGVILRS